MPYQINIFNIKVNGVAQNANIDFGNITQNSHTANIKSVGASFTAGDFSPNASIMGNANADPDISDQDQIANPSLPVTTQI
ncbi:spore germination protein [Bacillus sp. FJAT-42376]|uniref:spore germination protein n=1 Tax=Bacillus sp. FJAT-42376 TaxID=2014076 RepID=UPI000F4FE26E|nr:spore germination protein [Bacillus sp. FJAT-42376]AZB44244.1 spore germination protein [Bacillus sp. FJAT-42376]